MGVWKCGCKSKTPILPYTQTPQQKDSPMTTPFSPITLTPTRPFILQTLGDKPQGANEDQKLKSACQDFEAMLLGQVLKEMWASVVKGTKESKPGFSLSNQEETFRDLTNHELSKSIAKTTGVGVASMLYRELSKKSTSKDSNSGEVENNKQKVKDLNHSHTPILPLSVLRHPADGYSVHK
jgi:Rod binding domain-containing protein